LREGTHGLRPGGFNSIETQLDADVGGRTSKHHEQYSDLLLEWLGFCMVHDGFTVSLKALIHTGKKPSTRVAATIEIAAGCRIL